MQATAAKYAEALAHDIADTLNGPLGENYARAAYDHDAGTWAVSITHLGDRYDLLMPAAGVRYSLFRNEEWLGGINLTTDAAPGEVEFV